MLHLNASAEAQTPITIASGPPDGMYWKLGRTLEQDQQLAIKAIQTKGSGDNLKRLEAGEVRYALEQQDVVSEYFRDHSGKSGKPDTKVRVVGGAFFEYLHIFLRNSVHAQTATDLGRLRMWVGEEGSGTRLTAGRFFDHLGIPVSSLTQVKQLPADAGAKPEERWVSSQLLAREFGGDRLDAAMIVTTPGLPRACELMESGTASLFSVDPKTLRELTEEEETSYQGQIATGRIPANTYPHQADPVATIAVPVLLVARAKEKPETALSLLRTARQTWDHLLTEEPKPAGSKTVCKISGTNPQAAPLEASGLRMLEGLTPAEDTSLWLKIRPVVAWAFLLFGFAALGLWGFRRGWHEQVRSLWRRDKLPFFFALFLALGIMVVTLTTYFLERGINENFSTIRESFWSITVYLFSGLEDRTPYTDEGRIVATLGLLLGPVFFAVMSGWLARFFIHREKRMPHNLKDHFLLLNWNTRAADVVRELHHPIIREREGTFVVVVLADDESLEIRRFKEAGSGRDEAFEDFYVSIGDPTDERALRNANAADTRSILILTDDKYGDERTIRSILMLRKIAREAGRTDLHVVAELSNPANSGVIDELARDFPGLLEPISGLQIRTFLLSQAALSPGIVGFYSDLLKISAVTNEMYTLELPSGAVGMIFREYAAMVLKTYPDEPLVPIGVQRMMGGRSRMLTNPRRGEPGWVLEEGDHLLVMAYLPPLPGALPEPKVGEPVKT